MSRIQQANTTKLTPRLGSTLASWKPKNVCRYSFAKSKHNPLVIENIALQYNQNFKSFICVSFCTKKQSASMNFMIFRDNQLR